MAKLNTPAQRLVSQALSDYAETLRNLSEDTHNGSSGAQRRRFSAEAHQAQTLADALDEAMFVELAAVDIKDHLAAIWEKDGI